MDFITFFSFLRLCMNFNTFFAFMNLSGYETFNVANVRLSHILPKTLSRPSFKSSCGLKKGLPRLTSSKANPGLEHFLATLKQCYSSCITDCQHEMKREINLKTPSNKYLSFLPLSILWCYQWFLALNP